jgi:hypothetical protein
MVGQVLLIEDSHHRIFPWMLGIIESIAPVARDAEPGVLRYSPFCDVQLCQHLDANVPN